MIILDTNVLSALMRQVPDQHVITWLDRQPRTIDMDHFSHDL